jgi:hypothetical protein
VVDGFWVGHRNLLLIVDTVNALQDPGTRQRERRELQRNWIVSSAESGRKADEPLIKAVEVLADHAPDQRAR